MIDIFYTHISTGAILLQSLKKAGCQAAEDFLDNTCAVAIDLEIFHSITVFDLGRFCAYH